MLLKRGRTLYRVNPVKVAVRNSKVVLVGLGTRQCLRHQWQDHTLPLVLSPTQIHSFHHKYNVLGLPPNKSCGDCIDSLTLTFAGNEGLSIATSID